MRLLPSWGWMVVAPLLYGGVLGAAEFRFVGTAVDSYDRPLSGATIRLYLEETVPPLPKQTILTTNTISAADGSFELRIPAGHGYLVATKPGLAPAWRLWNEVGESDEIAGRLKLWEGSTISGTVVDSDGKPEADAEVFVTDAYFGREYGAQVYDPVSSPWLRDCLTTRSGADGHFRLDGVPPDCAVNLGIAKPGKVLHRKGRVSISLNSMMFVDGEAGVQLSTEAAGRIEGKVALPSGAGDLPANTWLWLQDQDHNRLVERQVTRPGAEGTFQFTNVAPGPYWVHAGFGTNPLPDWVAEAADMTVLEGEVSDGVNLTATKGGILEVKVGLTNGGGPVSDVTITTYRQSFQSASGPETAGLMRVRHPANECQVEAWRDGYRIKRTNVAVHFDQTNRLAFEVAPAPRIGGVATNRDGAPVAGVKVFVFPACGSCSQAAARTDPNGHYGIFWDVHTKVGDDPFFLIARDVARNLAGSIDVDPETNVFDMRLDEGLVIAGEVQDADGQPLTNAVVRLAVWNGAGGDWFDEHNPPKLDAEGRFKFAALPRDRVYSVRADARGYGEADSKKILVDTETASQINILPLILAKADSEISGKVVDEEGKPVAWADVFVNGRGQPGHHVRADAEGKFKVTELCPGNILVSAISRILRGRIPAQAGDTEIEVTVSKNLPAPAAPPPAPMGVPWKPSLL